MVSIIDGAFEGVIGVVDNVDTDNNSVRVVISMLGKRPRSILNSTRLKQ